MKFSHNPLGIFVTLTLCVGLMQFCLVSPTEAKETPAKVHEKKVNLESLPPQPPPTAEPPITTVDPNTTTTSTTANPNTTTTSTTSTTTPSPTTPTTTKPPPITTTTNPPSPNTTTTQAPTTTKPTTTTAAPTPKPEPDRKFDGPSFIGGMILTMGLMAIAFVSWKFYKARTERNYHTL